MNNDAFKTLLNAYYGQIYEWAKEDQLRFNDKIAIKIKYDFYCDIITDELFPMYGGRFHPFDYYFMGCKLVVDKSIKSDYEFIRGETAW